MFLQRAKNNKHVPQRMCAVCRLKTDKWNLIRIVKNSEGIPVVDSFQKLPGRGVYICDSYDCLKRAKKTGSLLRALKIKVDNDNFWTELQETITC